MSNDRWMRSGSTLLLVIVTFAAFSLPADVSGQKSTRSYRLAWVHVAPAPSQRPVFLEKFRARLAERGYVEGKNLVIEERWAGNEYGRVPTLAMELARSGVDVIFTARSRTARLVSEAVRSIPLVIYSCDPYEHVARIARPDANVTGVTCMTTELSPKRLQLLKEAVPTVSRVVFLHDPDDAPVGLKLTQEAAPRLGIALQAVKFKDRADIPNALAAVAKESPDALFIYPDPIGFAERRQIADFALRQRLPTMHAYREFVDAGGLMSYGANNDDLYTIMAEQVAPLFDGAKPGDVPLRQATRFELVINLKTAKALGVTIPPSLLLRADQVIE
jgi:putative tryptophan/tyrosine transport system substrate-binding protein